MEVPTHLDFDGETYNRKLDQTRLARQLANVYRLMHDQQWRTLYEIEQALGIPTQSASARIRDLRKPKFGSHTVERQRREGTFWYRLIPNKT